MMEHQTYRWAKGLLALARLHGAAVLVALAANMYAAGPVAAAELVMVEEIGCPWCEAWHREVGEIYPKTAEARIAPLRRVEIDAPWPPDLPNIGGVAYTPTFILIEGGCEVGRIVGYPGDAHFWGLLGALVDDLESKAEEWDSACLIPSR